MRILVCIKRVPAPGSRINVTDDEQSIDTAHLGFTTSPHEECALEEAVQIVEREGGDIVVLTAGPREAEEQLRYAASVGGTGFALIPTDGDWDPQRTAAALTEAIRSLEEKGGEFDLILFGNESADSGGFQVGIRSAYALGRPIVNGIKGIEVTPEGFTVQRGTDAGVEVYNVARPAVLGIKEGINLPRYPTMRGRLASRKAEIDTMALAAAAAGGQVRVRLHRPPEQASNTTILGTGPDAAPAVVDLLEELGIL